MKKTAVTIIALICVAGIFLTCCKRSERKRFTENTSEVSYQVVKDSVTGLFGFLSDDGTHRIACVYDSVAPFQDSNAAVCKDGRWGCVDALRNILIPCLYERLRLLGNGVARVRDHGLYGLLAAQSGDTLLPLCCSAITVFNDDFLLINKSNGYGLMNERLVIVTSEFYDSIHPIKDGLIRVVKDGRYGLLDGTGREVLNCMLDRIEPFIGERARVKAGALYGLIDRAGLLVLPCIYSEVKGCASEEAYIVTKLGYMGVVDRDGNLLIRTEFDKIEMVGDRLFLVGRDNRYGFIDLDGNPTTEMRYDGIRCMSDRLVCTEENGKYGLVSLYTGREVCPCRFDRIGSFHDGYARVRSGKWGYIDSEGDIVIPCRYDEARPFENGQALVAVAGKWTTIDKAGVEIAKD